jgi:hypothetical protein
MTQGKIERWHLSLKSRILLYYLPGDLQAEIGDLRYHESVSNSTPLLRTRPDHPNGTGKDQTTNNRLNQLAVSKTLTT